MAAGYCDQVDTAIPGAKAWLNSNQPLPSNLTAVEEAWVDVDATMVPACSEVTNDAVPIQTKNLTGGELTDTELANYVDLDTSRWTLWEWAGQHGQWGLLRYLYPPGAQAIAFVQHGGTIFDQSRACEYPSKVYAIVIDAANMAHLTGGQLADTGVGYALAWAGPCNTEWTSTSGQVTNYPVAAGSEAREVEVTAPGSAAALGQYLVGWASVDPGADHVASTILLESGV